MIKLMLITNQPDVAAFAVECGVDRIFIDLETLGKQERQGHLDTLISNHSLEDIPLIRAAIPNHELLVRINPVHQKTGYEIDCAINAGADIIMLPMFTTIEEVKQVVDLVAGRAKVMPLLETAEALNVLSELATVNGVSEIYIGLNDLHLSLNLGFMFEPLANGMIEEMVSVITAQGVPFGFGGIARVGDGALPAEVILGEHVRLGSSSVILSRTFHRASQTLEELKQNVDLALEISKLRQTEKNFIDGSPASMELNRKLLVKTVQSITHSVEN